MRQKLKIGTRSSKKKPTKGGMIPKIRYLGRGKTLENRKGKTIQNTDKFKKTGTK